MELQVIQKVSRDAAISQPRTEARNFGRLYRLGYAVELHFTIAITITPHHMSYAILTRFRRVISHHVLQQDHLISNRIDRASSILLLPPG
jgi:hypothetical protein